MIARTMTGSGTKAGSDGVFRCVLERVSPDWSFSRMPTNDDRDFPEKVDIRYGNAAKVVFSAAEMTTAAQASLALDQSGRLW